MEYFPRITLIGRTASRSVLSGGGCFAIAMTGCAHAPPIKAIEPTAPQTE